MEIRVIAFDADHTLYEIPESVKKRAHEKFFSFLEKETGIEREVIAKKFFEIFDNVLNSQHARNPACRKREFLTEKTLQALGSGAKRDTVSKAVEIFWKEIFRGLEKKRCVEKTVKELSGKFVLCVFTDEFEKIVQGKLQTIFGREWETLFEFLVTPEVTKEMKPSERYYEEIKRKTGAREEEIVVVGDSWERDLKIAKTLGMKTVLVKDRKEGKPDFYVKDFCELKEVIEKIERVERGEEK